ncbi:MAG: hypothetical protein CFE24_01730 [Flavobacterium sp. BFFFF2]|nr:MAG: hypothetical protein CFE24_01730 [Flavobacterium sp. BFFFF2]
MIAQSNRSVPRGYVTFNSKAIMAFKNLKINDKTIIFEIENTGNEMEFNLEAVESIANSEGEIVYSGKNTSAVINNLTDKKPISNNGNSQTNSTVLIYESRSKIFIKNKLLEKAELSMTLKKQNQAFADRFKRANNTADAGSFVMAFGIGTFIGGGTANLMGHGIGPAPLVFGIICFSTGLVINLVAADSARQVITDYNISTMNTKPHAYKAQLDLIASGQGIGLKCSF